MSSRCEVYEDRRHLCLIDKTRPGALQIPESKIVIRNDRPCIHVQRFQKGKNVDISDSPKNYTLEETLISTVIPTRRKIPMMSERLPTRIPVIRAPGNGGEQHVL
jgi:hypothetical protein